MAIEGVERYMRSLREETNAEGLVLLNAQRRDVGVALMAKLIDLTAVDTGEARRGWAFRAQYPTSTVTQQDDPFGDLVQILGQIGPADPIYIQNNVEQTRILDDGLFQPADPGPSKDPRKGRTGKVLVAGGYSVQAPRGITGDALDTVAQQFGLKRLRGESDG